ncbi:putative membrane protein [Roseovarius mucosus DSM 17069]|uniref:Putative membrane protein n=1 Tax=Roseovarius mucosus DSM 17069 TaxID=1288298 RepID=A0A0A0HF92_9RHOB|nr:DMT family transporter [Roseovarius mucosus]KGM86392.1 putative membrane protein [Roseovarius mucosus DSM 17069]
MTALILGLVAALAWGTHDVCVRYVSQNNGIFAPLVWVLAFGLMIVTPISAYAGLHAPQGGDIGLAVLAGVFFGIGGTALYRAFSIGPVRLVAPVIGAYPILSVGWASLNGAPTTPLEWIMVGLIICGVAYIAQSDAGHDTAEAPASPLPAIGWSLLAAAGFALTFAIGHQATATGGELLLLAPTRAAALAVVLGFALALRAPLALSRRHAPLLLLMGTLDALAIGCVIGAGQTARPEFAAIGASTFGVITVLFAAIFLRERLRGTQWLAVLGVFTAIGILGGGH